MVARISSKHPNLKVEVFTPPGRSIYLVSLGGGDMDHDEAVKMLDKARSESTSVQQQRAAAERLGKLTAREHQVLERIIAGRLNKQIADDLGISIKTVEAHRANIMEKLNVNTVADLLRLALSNKPQTAQ